MTWKAWFTSLIQAFVGSVADAGAGRVTEKIAIKTKDAPKARILAKSGTPAPPA